MNRKYLDLVAEKDRFVREFRELIDTAARVGVSSPFADKGLEAAIEGWEAKFPRLSKLFKERAGI